MRRLLVLGARKKIYLPIFVDYEQLDETLAF
ncbi:Uncharacterised protein [Vibrio cholerae]|nr:Uncharacterised protein [Vibrio cholerae]